MSRTGGWFRIAFSNPINFQSPNSELFLLQENKSILLPLLRNRLQVHYGIGVGETEQQLVIWQLEEARRAEVAAIDCEREFLLNFVDNLAQRKIDFGSKRIMFLGRNCLFSEVQPAWLDFANSSFDAKCHICLGSTIGNFQPQQEIWDVFSRNTGKGDLLLLGFQLDTYLQETLQKYASHSAYPAFVMDRLEAPVASRPIWSADLESSFISLQFDGMEVFRARKYKKGRVAEELAPFGFSPVLELIDKWKNYCIAVFEKVS
ncbi:MAG: L-histidine N(alpha)-methyltransferase [Candidatus Micrarchaeota archaeon]|nr:L-histidine N(alpha)-methyltransferase [Candidatus Micrarchaeota archaeon]